MVVPNTPCMISPLAKQKKLHFPNNNHFSVSPFELVQCDVWGPFSISTVEGYIFFLTSVDDSTRTTWIYPFKYKSEVPLLIRSFFKLVKNQFHKKKKKIVLTMVHNFFIPIFWIPNVSYINIVVLRLFNIVVVERKHHHILNIARALLVQSHLPIRFWGDAILIAIYIINRLPTPILQYKSHFELLLHSSPSYDHLRTFGCLCFASTLQRSRTKFDPKACACVFLQYAFGIKCYKLLDINTN